VLGTSSVPPLSVERGFFSCGDIFFLIFFYTGRMGAMVKTSFSLVNASAHFSEKWKGTSLARRLDKGSAIY